MKKLITTLTAAALTAACAVPFISSAEYIPTFYMKVKDNASAFVNSDGTLIIHRSAVGDGLTLNGEVYIEDESLTCWYVAPKVKSASKSVKLANPVNPIPDKNDKDGAFIEYAYAEKDEDGNLTASHNETLLTLNENLNIINFTCQRPRTMTDSSPLVPYGEKTDDYPLLTFDIQLSGDIECDEYSVYFLTEPEDDPDQRISQVGMRVNGSTIAVPNVQNMKIAVVDSVLGDVNGDGSVNAVDASAVLVAYSKISTGQPSGLTYAQCYSANVNKDAMIDAKDASSILTYYAYASTTSGELMSIEEFLKSGK